MGGGVFMQITDVRIRKVTKEGKMKAVVSITLDDEFAVHDIKVIEGDKGLFIAMPSRKTSDGEYRDIAHPINSVTRDRIQSLILNKYDEMLQQEDSGRKSSHFIGIIISSKFLLYWVSRSAPLCVTRMSSSRRIPPIPSR